MFDLIHYFPFINQISPEEWASLIGGLSRKLATELPNATDEKIKHVSDLMKEGFKQTHSG